MPLPVWLDASRRALYRVVYPMTDRPSIKIDRRVLDVLDVSEVALRYETREEELPEIGAAVTAILQLRNCDPLNVNGEVIRSRGGMVVLQLTRPGVPFSCILQEQRYLRTKGYRVE